MPETTSSTYAARKRRHLAVSLRSDEVVDALRHLASSLLPLLCAATSATSELEEGSRCTLRLVESGLIVSSPGAAAQPLHSDTDGSATSREARTFKLQIGTVNTSEAMGPLEVVPGSHVWASAAGPVPAADSRTVALTAPPGAVVVYDARLWHRGGANKSRRKRPVFYITVIAPGGRVPGGLPFTVHPEDAGCFVLTEGGLEDRFCREGR